jgi:uncharacterized protein YdeI (YjbR/CyaY-like superfamily)
MSAGRTGGEPRPQFAARDRRAWRAWLARNHARATEVWLVFYKRGTGRPTIGYEAAVEEGLCFGWIDGQKRSLDVERYAFRFTPRRRGSKWSASNLERAQKLIEAGRMQVAGRAAYDARQSYPKEVLARLAAPELALAPEVASVLRSRSRAWRNFEALAPGYRKQYVAWINAAKRPATRRKRLAEALELLTAGRKLGMK